MSKTEELLLIKDLLRLVTALMPGIKSIAVQDYQAVNEVPIRAQEYINKHTSRFQAEAELDETCRGYK